MQITRWRQNGLLRKRTVRISTLAALLAVGASFASLQVSGLSVGVDGCATTIYFDYQSAHADSAAAAVAELAPFVEQLDPDLPEHSRTRFAALGWAAKRALTTSDEGKHHNLPDADRNRDSGGVPCRSPWRQVGGDRCIDDNAEQFLRRDRRDRGVSPPASRPCEYLVRYGICFPCYSLHPC